MVLLEQQASCRAINLGDLCAPHAAASELVVVGIKKMTRICASIKIGVDLLPKDACLVIKAGGWAGGPVYVA